MKSSTPKAHAAIFDLAAQLFINQMKRLPVMSGNEVTLTATRSVIEAQIFVQTFKNIVLDAKSASKQ